MRPRGGGRDDRGSVTVLVALIAVAILATLTLVVDGGARIRAATQADTVAAEAARAAALAYAPHPGRGSADLAAQAARRYLNAADATGTVTVTGPARITITVQVTRRGPLSGASFTVSRTATAQLRTGVETGEGPPA
jgi:Flp pilus assembly protein TadG